MIARSNNSVMNLTYISNSSDAVALHNVKAASSVNHYISNSLGAVASHDVKAVSSINHYISNSPGTVASYGTKAASSADHYISNSLSSSVLWLGKYLSHEEWEALLKMCANLQAYNKAAEELGEIHGEMIVNMVADFGEQTYQVCSGVVYSAGG
ncbi:hypothetical protein DACRYDRAFT_13100 [Dacryopinax primogenitus]|uniref:Uncharacterized protein n=1 Tax=Dacryopinax primogenitus (strain DJM 731) TaxID=1858805 RepID=M5GH14_DACPD|nr:uncharacterized protein DACRYDRAFT_13100 [Dacryopinax primogenitus]EJU06443.1 hypothetical protein DACRYDRAFT_13100 [Dacryopinax primogenitus]